MCTPKQSRLCSEATCMVCFDRSMASHPKAQYWSSVNDKSPREVMRNSNGIYLFDCSCEHRFIIRPNDLTNKERWCPYCANQKLCDNEFCESCWDRSFQSHHRSAYWSDKNSKQPREVFLQSNKKYWFFCEAGHEFEAVLHTITKGHWCAQCRYKTQEKLRRWLQEHYPAFKPEGKFPWSGRRRYDFVDADLKIIIELDGEQHFEQRSNWDSADSAQQLDIMKMRLANLQGYTVVRLLQEDVLFDRVNWQSLLRDAIHQYSEPIVIYLSERYQYTHAPIMELYNILL